MTVLWRTPTLQLYPACHDRPVRRAAAAVPPTWPPGLRPVATLDQHFETFQRVYDEQFQAKYGFWRPIVDAP